MARHATSPEVPPLPQQLLVEPDPEPDDGHFGLILGVVAMLCATALMSFMVMAGHGDSVGGLLIACVLAGGAVKVTDLLRKTVLAILAHFR
jgi:hypothetical protein